MKKCVGVILVIVILLSISMWCEKVPYKKSNETEMVSETTMFVPKSYLLGVVKEDSDVNLINYEKSFKEEKKEKNDDFILLKDNNKTTHYKFIVTSDDNDKIKPTVKPTKKTQVKATVKPNKTHKSKSNSYSDEDFYVLSHVIFGEASGQSWDFQVAVGSVVLNRVKSNKYPNTIKKVVFQKGQYACTWDGNYNKTPNEQTKKVTRYLLKYGSQLPSKVLYQAEFVQGKGIYKKMGNTYLCY